MNLHVEANGLLQARKTSAKTRNDRIENKSHKIISITPQSIRISHKNSLFDGKKVDRSFVRSFDVKFQPSMENIQCVRYTKITCY